MRWHNVWPPYLEGMETASLHCWLDDSLYSASYGKDSSSLTTSEYSTSLTIPGIYWPLFIYLCVKRQREILYLHMPNTHNSCDWVLMKLRTRTQSGSSTCVSGLKYLCHLLIVKVRPSTKQKWDSKPGTLMGCRCPWKELNQCIKAHPIYIKTLFVYFLEKYQLKSLWKKVLENMPIGCSTVKTEKFEE